MHLSRKLHAVAAGRIQRLMVQCPPRHGKSMLCSQFFPAWYLGTYPDRRVILTSYEADFAASWGRKARDVLTEHGPELWGVTIRDDSSAANRWDIEGNTGGMQTAGVGGPVTGKGAHLLLIDDPVKNDEQARSPTYRERAWEWYRSTAYTRLEPGGAVVLVMTRWHRDDLAGKILAQAADTGEKWEVVRLPAIAEENDQLGRAPGKPLWPARYPLDVLERIRATTEAYWWACLYQQDPAPEGGAEWPETYFGPDIWFDEWPLDLRLRVLALDPSKGKDAKFGDYSAFTMLGVDSQGCLWVDADLARRPTADIVATGLELCRTFKPDGFAVETNQFQELLKIEFERAAATRGVVLPTYGIVNTVNKAVRIRRLGPYLAQHKIRFKGGSHGAKLLVQQLRDFPCGEHDDGADSLEMAVRLGVELWNGKLRNQEPMRLGV